MESKERIGLYGSGEVPRSRRLWSKSPGPESLGLKDIRQLPPIRRVRPVNKRKTIVASALTAIIALAAVLAVVSAFTLAPSGTMQQNKRGTLQAPITPYPVIGIVFDNLGVPLGGAHINITDTHTGLYNNTLVSDSTPGSEGYYIFDANTLGGGAPVNPGDVFTIVGNDSLMMGSNTTVIPVVFTGYIWFNVTLNLTIPEFTTALIPVMGVLGMVVALVLVARARDE